GDFAEAESQYRLALPGRATAETHNGLGYVLAHQGRDEEAVAEFRKAIDIDPKFTPAYNNLAEAYEHQNKREDAAENHRPAPAEKPSAGGYNALGRVLGRLGRADEAADQFGKAQAFQSAP